MRTGCAGRPIAVVRVAELNFVRGAVALRISQRGAAARGDKGHRRWGRRWRSRCCGRRQRGRRGRRRRRRRPCLLVCDSVGESTDAFARRALRSSGAGRTLRVHDRQRHRLVQGNALTTWPFPEAVADPESKSEAGHGYNSHVPARELHVRTRRAQAGRDERLFLQLSAVADVC